MAEATDNTDDIKIESKIITKELLETALRSKEKNDGLKVETFTVTAGCLEGDNYATVAFSVKVTTTDKDGEQKVHDLFIKAAHDNELLREWTFVESQIFVKETKTYSEIIPDMISYQNDRGIEPIGPSVPNFVYGMAANYKGIIVLEDLRPRGYLQADRLTGLDYEHCKLVMTKLAAFHALAYALKNGNLENLKKYNFLFRDSLFTVRVPIAMEKALKASVGMMESITANSNTIQSVEKLLRMDLFTTIRKHIEPIEPYAVICHGDMWCNNLLFKYDEKKDGQKPIDVKLLDLQIVRYALPTTDLAYFFYTSTTRDTRKKHLRELLRIYHNALSDFLQKLRVDFDVFSYVELEKMFAQNIVLGVLSACFASPTFLTQPKSFTEFTGQTEDEARVFLEKYFKQLVEIDENVPIIRDRLLGSVQEAMEWGVL